MTEIIQPIHSDSLDYEDILARIRDIYDSCNPIEQAQFIKIIEELSDKGYSETLERIYLIDFKEVPVSIDRFLTDPEYLGESNDCGNQIYPGWWDAYHSVFDSQSEKYEVILSGATRIGKTSTAVSMMCYMLYLLMCYRNPQKYFGLKEVSRATIAFANLTKDLAQGVAFREFNDTLLKSPWFNKHGRFTNSATRPIYIPEGNQIELVAASSGSMILGMQLWCLVGSTKILTSAGVKTLAECENTYREVFQYSSGGVVTSNAYITKTKEVTETIRITLADGTVIEGTPEHKVLLSDGTYKALGEITEGDDLMDINMQTFGNFSTVIPDVPISLGTDWHPLVGTNNLIWVSSSGEVYVQPYIKSDCLGRTYHYGGITLTPQTDRGGYLYVELPIVRKKYKVHRLVAFAFLSNPQNLPQVNHIDGNKQNNSVDNLEWVSAQENIAHAFRTGLRNINREISLCKTMSKGNRKKVRCITTGEIFNSLCEAASRFGLTHQGLQARIKTGRPTRSGFRFEYISDESN